MNMLICEFQIRLPLLVIERVIEKPPECPLYEIGIFVFCVHSTLEADVNPANLILAALLALDDYAYICSCPSVLCPATHPFAIE